MTGLVDLDIDRIVRVRRHDPGAVARAWAARRRRPLLGDDGRLLIVAADHMARGALGVRDDPRAMADRPDVLRRLATALSRPGVDGVLGTPDILDDLLLAGLLEDKVVIGSMNRGGLQGAGFELDDRFTAYAASDIAALGLDGGKMLTRICLEDDGTAPTLEASARAISELAQAQVMAMIEPFWSVRDGGRAATGSERASGPERDQQVRAATGGEGASGPERGRPGRVKNLLDPDSVIRSMHVAAGLGGRSAYTWLKLPVVDDMERVLAATTMPVLMLGGDPTGDPQETYATWGRALACPSAAGLVVGRALLYPPDGDVAGAVDIAARLVHGDDPASGAPAANPTNTEGDS